MFELLTHEISEWLKKNKIITHSSKSGVSRVHKRDIRGIEYWIELESFDTINKMERESINAAFVFDFTFQFRKLIVTRNFLLNIIDSHMN